MAALTALPRCRIVREESNYVHAEVRSRLFGFIDDLELYIDSRAGVVHMRSASRVGYWDLGVNRKRLQALRRAFERRQPSEGR